MCAGLPPSLSKRGARRFGLLYPCAAMTSAWKAGLALGLVALFVAPGAPAQKRRRARRAPTPTPTPAATPTPTPIPLLRAAGFCLRYEKDHFLVLAELGQAGRVFHIDKSTVVAAKVSTGARLRILYVETPEGPLAKRIIAGPVEPAATPVK